MFGIVGRIVVYGFCLYIILRVLQDQHSPDTEEVLPETVSKHDTC
jgi:hypothetical protein